MLENGKAKFESFSNYPWLDYNKHQDAWLLVVGAGSNAQKQCCILTVVGDNVYRAIITQEIYDAVMAHTGSPLNVKYAFDSKGELYVELKEVNQSG